MAGGCCCIDDHRSTITAFAVMNIVIFAACLLACSKEYAIAYPLLKDLDYYKEEASDWIDKEVYTYRIKHYSCALIAAIIISVFGLIAGLALLCVPNTKSTFLCTVWIIFECFELITMIILGGFITHIKNLNGPISWRQTLPAIPYSALFLLCSCPFILWSVISICMSLQGISDSAERRCMALNYHDDDRHHFKMTSPGSNSIAEPNSTVIQFPDTIM